MDGHALIFIAFIIFFSKLFSGLFRKIKLPSVLSMILIGIVIGPTGINLIRIESDMEIIKFFSEIGVLILLFLAGIETDLKELKSIGKNSTLIAIGGVILPFITAGLVTYFFTKKIENAVMMGLISTATSVSVSIMTLMDMGKLNTVEGKTVVSAAIIDDIVGILLLSVVLGIYGGEEGKSSGFLVTVGIIIVFFIVIFIFGFFILPIFTKAVSKIDEEMIVLSFAFSIMFLFAYFAEKLQIAAVTGAYFAGIFIGRTKQKHLIEESFKTIGHTLFVSVFFVYIGIQANLRIFSLDILPYMSIFLVIAFISKILGCGVVSKILGFDIKRSFAIGSGMAPRGEVALIIAALALNGKMISDKDFTLVIFMVIITAFVTPFLLKLGFKE